MICNLFKVDTKAFEKIMVLKPLTILKDNILLKHRSPAH
jgi:hypothetical protein